MKKIMQLLTLGVLAMFCVNGQPVQDNDPNGLTVTQGGKTYRITAVGDKLPSFTVNGRSISKEFFEDYEPLFTELQNRLEEKKKKLAQKSGVLTDETRAALVVDLVRDKIIETASKLLSFKLDNNAFIVNGRQQSFDAFARYKAKYLTGANYIIQFN